MLGSFRDRQILAGKVLGYDPGRRFRQRDHTLANVFLALERLFVDAKAAVRAKMQLAGYLVLDALIGNTDRHHENWGVLLKRVGNKWQGVLAPTFDHASSLGRELMDESEGKCRRLILMQHGTGAYAEKAHGAIYWSESDRRGISPLELVRRATSVHPNLLRTALEKLERVDRRKVDSIIERIPVDWMSGLAREFALELICYNLEEMRKLRA